MSRSAPRQQTVRIVLESAPPSAVSRYPGLPQKLNPQPRKAKL